MKTLTGLTVRSSVEFSPCGQYRYSLIRVWDDRLPRCVFVMLNPSTADLEKNDPTVARCMGFAERWGFGSYEVVNLFALRSTDPKALYSAPDPIGISNDRAIRRATAGASRVVAAWGNHGAHLRRGPAVLEALLRSGPVQHFGLTQRGQPRHPLYVPWVATLKEIDDGVENHQ